MRTERLLNPVRIQINLNWQSIPSVYIHVPFCRHRCGYCNFSLVADRDYLIDAYLAGIASELRFWGRGRRRQVQTVFIGGGTPSHLPPEKLQALLEIIREHLDPANGGEFSCEANPQDISESKVQLLADYGVNRLSLGAQSLHASKLSHLERDHSPATIRSAVDLARKSISNISLDLIFGLPGESVASWTGDLRHALSCGIEHLSAYELTIEKGTRFWNRQRRGESLACSDDRNADLYRATQDCLAEGGFEHYEISNFARPGFRCRHNTAYWNGSRYLAVGPSAASLVYGTMAPPQFYRWINHLSLSKYLRSLANGERPIGDCESVTPLQAAAEFLAFGIRQIDGVDLKRIAQITGIDPRGPFGGDLTAWQAKGMVLLDGDQLRLTNQGHLFADLVGRDFIATGTGHGGPLKSNECRGGQETDRAPGEVVHVTDRQH